MRTKQQESMQSERFSDGEFRTAATANNRFFHPELARSNRSQHQLYERLKVRMSECRSYRLLSRLISYAHFVKKGESSLQEAWHENRTQLLELLEQLLCCKHSPHLLHRGHLHMANQLIGKSSGKSKLHTGLTRLQPTTSPNDAGGVRSNRLRKRQLRIALQLLQRLESLRIPTSSSNDQTEYCFMEQILTEAEDILKESFLHQPPLNKAAKRLQEAFNRLLESLLQSLEPQIQKLRQRTSVKVYRGAWEALSTESDLQGEYTTFLAAWTHFCHLLLLEQVGRTMQMENLHLSRLLHDASTHWHGTPLSKRLPIHAMER